MRHFALIFLSLFALSACTRQISEVCGGTGSCCSLAFTNNTEGNPEHNYHQCVAESGPCPPESVDESLVIDRIFPNDSPEEGKCGAEWETVWIWEGDFWRTSSSSSEVSTYMSSLNIASAKVAMEADDLPALPPKTDINYCVAACQRADQTGGFGLCPSGDVPNDVSVGLLRLIAKYAKISDIPNQVKDLSSVFDEFQVTVDDNACSRGSLVISDEKITNTGEMCKTKVSFKSGPNKIFLNATLSLPSTIISDVSSGDGFALFPQNSMSYDIRFDDPFLQAGYGGTFSVVTEDDGISVVATTSANSISPCLRVQPSVQDEADALAAFAEAITAESSVIERVTNDLRSFAAEVEEFAASENVLGVVAPKTKFSDYADPFPFSTELRRMTKTLSTIEQKKKVDEFLVSKAMDAETGIPVRYSDVVTLLDMAYCSQQFDGGLERIDLARYYPKTDLFSASLDEMRFRDTQASKLLLCTRVFDSLNPKTRETLAEAVQSFLE